VDPEVVASIPLGAVTLAALMVLALGVAAGWWASRARLKRRLARTVLDHSRQVAELLDALPQAALIADADNRLIIRNAKAANLLKEFNPDNTLPIAVDAAVGRVIHSREAETLEIASPDNPARRLQVTVAPLQANPGAVEALLLFTDPDAGSGRVELYQRLTGALAHELRTPLTAIMGHVEILSSYRLDEEALWRRSLSFIAGEVERLARLVEDLLSLSRLDRVPLQIQSVNVRVAAEEALSALFETAERKSVSLVLQAPPELPRVQADSDRIRQVFLNLVENGIKYAPGGTVTVRLALEGDRVRIAVSDDGPGIASEDLPYIFEPFHRGKRAAPGSQGAGLGLAIVRVILNQHNTPINVHSLLDQGTTFTFSFPIAPAA